MRAHPTAAEPDAFAVRVQPLFAFAEYTVVAVLFFYSFDINIGRWDIFGIKSQAYPT